MRYGIPVLLLFFALQTISSQAFAQTGDQDATFAKAYELYTNGKFADAKEFFEKLLDPDFRLADYSEYYLAAINYKLADWAQARAMIAQLKQRFPQSIWIQPAELLRAKIDIAEQKYDAAGDNLRRLRADKSVKREVNDEALYLQAQLREADGDPLGAQKLYNDLRDASPNSRWAAAARKAQISLREKFPDLFAFQTTDALAAEADRLARERQSVEAETLYKKLLNNASDADSRLRFLTKLANLLLSTGNRSEAIPMLETIVHEFPETHEAPKALYEIGQIYWNRHENSRALEYFTSLLAQYPTSPYADRARFAAADIHEYFGRRTEAVQLYTDILKQSATTPVRDDAAWRLAWLYYLSGELSSASETFKDLALKSNNSTLTTAALYWQARIAEKASEPDRARQLYRQIVDGAAESYYQTLAARALRRLGDVVQDPKWVPPPAPQEPEPPMSPELLFHLSRARSLTALSLRSLAVAELDELNRGPKKGNRMRAFLMQAYFQAGAYARSLQLANQLPSSRSDRELYRYPLAFWDLIQQKAQDRGLDPYLVLALIRQESLFDTQARSPAAALGLMQLIPPTATRIAKELGLPEPSQETLLGPELNLTLGTQYLKDLLQRYGNSWQKAIAAYNAGESAVDRWQKEIPTDDIEEFVERIPYVETRGYVKLVLRNHDMYKRLYDTAK